MPSIACINVYYSKSVHQKKLVPKSSVTDRHELMMLIKQHINCETYTLKGVDVSQAGYNSNCINIA